MNALLALLLLPLAIGAPTMESASAGRFRLLGEALAQAERITGQWDPGQRDCAGFVRYLYRKSVPGTDPLWLDRNKAPALFLSAEELLAYNFESLGKAPAAKTMETGDILAFHLAHKPPNEAWHLMLLLRPPGMATDRTLVVYHNGADGKEGQVRKVWLEDLQQGPPEWRPSVSNARFVGVFRWRGWSERFSKGR